MPGTTGDIIWRRRDPKTVELYNTDREAGGPEVSPAATAPASRADEIRAATGSTERGRSEDPYAHDPDRKLSAAEKKEHRQRLKDFMKFWKTSDPMEFDPTDGIQELLDGGIIWHEEDGWGSYVNPHMPKKDREAFVAAADAWGDRVGLWKDGQYDPEAPRRYWEQQRAMQQGTYP